ncbi:MAG TPA: hypothetical protein VD816_02780 [Ohtaekwangia sp.]|nr:hypothetical protein [Ohtaekwangia sp.]
MKKPLLALLLWCAVLITASGQAKTRRLPSIINHPSLDLYAPYISLDGNALLFIANTGQDGALSLSYTSRESDWTAPVEMPKHVTTRLNFIRGYALSADGRKMYYTCAKSPVIGGYDIFVTELKGTTWTAGENMLLPINSKQNDGSPSVTADGNAIYFMRCERMDQLKADGCQLFVARKKSNGQWEEPTALPANINTGNSQAPRIMADNQTLIFSSDKMGGKGGMDLFVTKLADGEWSQPVAMDFVNTEKDDQYVSVAALGRYLLKESPGARKNSEITEFLIPDELRPKGLMKVEGKISDDNGAPVPAYISVMDLQANKRVFSGRPAADGTYFLYLMEGSQYEISFDPEQSNMTFYARRFDLTTDKISQKEKINVTLKKPAPGEELSLDLVAFKPASTELEPAAEAELKRLARVIKANPQRKFEIHVLLNGYAEDSIQSDADLTEMTIDSVLAKYDDIDSLGQLYQRDTLVAKITYHNDRTLAQARRIVEFLAAEGADQSKLKFFGNAIPATAPENRKTTVKAFVR